MIKSLLIANRGEIACRVIRTAKKMGIRSIAVYSAADENALHVRMADEAHFLGPAPAADSYLRAGRILKIAKEAKADAIHPGYGFLSENADFAELTANAGMIFIGPPPDAIRSMGQKDRAKEIMNDAGVPVVPGFHGPNQDPTFLKRKAYEVGYPVLIKAVSGGGGKGMRKVLKAIEFDTALDAAKREAQAAFGNDVVLIEKFISSPRHIEIQVFGDSKGNVVHLFERDCSLQRRHQKVIEEAPAPGMTKGVRDAMGNAACDAARAVGYEGAGTVEFIVDAEDGLNEDKFWFMEMNTRLQVEHPVTEMITGVDLVEWQILVAQGEELPLAQEDIVLNGHAVEARIYAEDAASGFLPSTGTLVALDFGETGTGVRVETGVEQGDSITPFYDPMIAKLVVHAPKRRQAMESLEQHLKAIRIAGLTANIGFLVNLTASKAFLAENFDTGLIDRELDDLIGSEPVSDEVVATGIVALLQQRNGRINVSGPDNVVGFVSPWQATDSFQLNGAREMDWVFMLDGVRVSRRIQQASGRLKIRAEDDSWIEARTDLATYTHKQRVFIVDNARQTIFADAAFEVQDGTHGGLEDGAVRIPMHGKIIAVTVKEGEEVEQGDMLFSIEAMKMEHAVLAPKDGIVTGFEITAGEQVESGRLAMTLRDVAED